MSYCDKDDILFYIKQFQAYCRDIDNEKKSGLFLFQMAKSMTHPKSLWVSDHCKYVFGVSLIHLYTFIQKKIIQRLIEIKRKRPAYQKYIFCEKFKTKISIDLLSIFQFLYDILTQTDVTLKILYLKMIMDIFLSVIFDLFCFSISCKIICQIWLKKRSLEPI